MTPQTDQASDMTNLLEPTKWRRMRIWLRSCSITNRIPGENPARSTRKWPRAVLARYQKQPRPLILDSFCGTGMSTGPASRKYPDKWVVGIDQSAHRLAKHPHSVAENCLLLQAEAEPFGSVWPRLASLHAHWLLYPNPWPKASQFKRRVHGHGAFPVLARLGARWKCEATGLFMLRSSPRPPR
ncbi:MAG: hypothetical protein CM15mP74_15730 [Halieaceae bacterium]|nr:MAG: hypothetical protein CM15mP74_15730 [Halieaceae bacterium]